MEKSLFVLFVFVILQFPVFCHAQEEVFPTGTVWKEVMDEVYNPEYPQYHTPMDTFTAAGLQILLN